MTARFTVFAIAPAFIAGCGKSTPPPPAAPAKTMGSPEAPTMAQPAAPKAEAWKSISGGTPVRFAGVEAQVPGGWTVIPQGNATLLNPPGANQTMIEELYGFIGEPSLKTLDAPELEPYLDMSVSQLLQAPAQRSGPAESIKVGALDGKLWKWTARLMDGRDVEVRSWAFVGSYAGALVAIAPASTLSRRAAELDAIRASFHRPAAAAIDSARLVGTWVRAFGGGSALIGNSNEQRITFDASGRFHYHSEGTSHGIFHNSSSQTDITGSWQLKGDQLTGAADSGTSQTFTLEARTEAGTGAAVIAIDGTEFRQLDGRPW